MRRLNKIRNCCVCERLLAAYLVLLLMNNEGGQRGWERGGVSAASHAFILVCGFNFVPPSHSISCSVGLSLSDPPIQPRAFLVLFPLIPIFVLAVIACMDLCRGSLRS
jgi:hypothetical protein